MKPGEIDVLHLVDTIGEEEEESPQVDDTNSEDEDRSQ
jgi:hypothetical protein